jgi:very-short-patch-repair endonuclease
VLVVISRNAEFLTGPNLGIAFQRLAKIGARMPAAGQSALVSDPRTKLLGCAPASHLRAPAALTHARRARSATLLARIGEQSARGLASALWAHAKLGHGPPRMLLAAWLHVVARAPEMNVQELGSALWAYATAATRGGAVEKVAPLFRELAPVLAARARAESSPSEHSLSTAAWSYGAVGVADADLLCALEAAAAPRLRGFTAQGLCNLAWAFAVLGHTPPAFFAALGDAAAALPGTLAPLDAASLAHALATAGAPHERALAAVRASVAHAAPRGEYTGRQLATTARALAALGVADTRTMNVLADAALRATRRGALEPLGAAQLAWACAASRHDAPALMEALAVYSLPRLQRFSPLGLAMLCFAYAALAHDAPALQRALAAEVDARSAEFDGPALTIAARGLVAVPGGAAAPTFRRVRAALAALAPRLRAHELAQVYQIEMVMSAEGVPRDAGDAGDAAALADEGGEMSASRVFAALFASGEARASARSAWREQAREERRHQSATQRAVMAATARVAAREGLPAPVAEHTLRDGYSLDVAWPAARVGLEVDGPSHFAANTRRALGATRLKQRLVAAAGWRVVSLPFWEVDAAAGPDALDAAVRARLGTPLLRRLADAHAPKPPKPALAEEEASEEATEAQIEARAEAMALIRARAAGGSAGAALRGVLAARARRATDS